MGPRRIIAVAGNMGSGKSTLVRWLEKQFDIIPRSQADQPDAIWQIIGHFDRAGANRAGAAEQDNVLHGGNGVMEQGSIGWMDIA